MKQRAIHVPTRAEGHAHASQAAREWGAESQHFAAASPPGDLPRFKERAARAIILLSEPGPRREGLPHRTVETMKLALSEMR